MRVMYFQPKKAPSVIEIENSVNSIQELVGGYFDMERLTSELVILYNEEDGFILGNSIVARVNGSEIESLTDDDIEKIPALFIGKTAEALF